MSGFRARFDQSLGAAFATVTVPASSRHIVAITAQTPDSSLAAILTGGGTGGGYVISLTGDGIFWSHDFGSWQWWTAQALGAAAGTSDGSPTALVGDALSAGGTLWDIDWKVGGVTLFSDLGVDLGVSALDPFVVSVGADGGAIIGNICFVSSVEIRNAANAIVFSDDFASDSFAAFDSTTGDATVVGTGPAPPPPPPFPPPDPPDNVSPAALPYQSPRWRYVIGDLVTFETLSFLDRLATARTENFVLNQPSVATGKVPSDNPEINIPWPDPDSDPFLSEGSRVLWGFREEGPPEDPWVIRSSKMILQLADDAQSDDAFSTYTAFDPWQYLFSRPICNADGSLPGPKGISFTATRADVIAGTLLKNAILTQGLGSDPATTGIDAGLTYAGTSFYGGAIEACAAIDINFPQGTSVGQAWKILADQNLLDIRLEPIYDPTNRPGYLVELNIYTEAGAPRDDAIFAWDMPSKSLVAINRLIDGTQRDNVVKWFAGQGGSAVGGQTIPAQEDDPSIIKYGPYWSQVFFPGQTVAAVVLQLAIAQLELAKNGKTTVSFSPAPERSPHPFTDYWLGDRVPVYASSRFRFPIPSPALAGSTAADNYQRVYGVPITIDDDGTEQIVALLTALPTAG